MKTGQGGEADTQETASRGDGEETGESGGSDETGDDGTGQTGSESTADADASGGSDGDMAADGGGGSTEDDLDRALRDFDGKIMNERREVAKRANESAGENPIDDPGGEGEEETGGSKRAGDLGDIDVGDGGEIPGKEGSQNGDPTVAKGGKGTTGAGGAMPDIDVDAAPPPPPPLAKSDTKKADLPKDVADAKDDDVVARQLREAAMAEPDPVMREKLWEEYRRYKAGR
jgi:hypothetical protein